jgi:hypothetical protein
MPSAISEQIAAISATGLFAFAAGTTFIEVGTAFAGSASSVTTEVRDESSAR